MDILAPTARYPSTLSYNTGIYTMHVYYSLFMSFFSADIVQRIPFGASEAGLDVIAIQGHWPALQETNSIITITSSQKRSIERLSREMQGKQEIPTKYTEGWKAFVENTNSPISLRQYWSLAPAAEARSPRPLRETPKGAENVAVPSVMAGKQRGMKNLGRTCYLNAAVHILVQCKPIFNAVLPNPHPDLRSIETIPEDQRNRAADARELLGAVRDTFKDAVLSGPPFSPLDLHEAL